MAMRGARRQGDPLLRSGRTPERTALLAPALLVAAMMFVGVGAGGIDRLASLGEIATGPTPPGEQLPGSSSRARENAASVLTHRLGADPRSAGDGGAAGEGSRAGSAATGVADLSAPAGAAAAPISAPSSDPGGGLAGGGSPAPGPVGVPDAAPPVRDRVAPIERVVDELLEDLGSQSERVPPARRKLELRFED